MAAQLLIYERVTPITIERHGDWSVKGSTDYSFARRINSVPLVAAEFANAATEYAIVFSGPADELMPVAVLGVKENDNLYVDANGAWQAGYVPAFVRRYPFVFSSADEGKTFTLCIDEDYAGCNQTGEGERLFDSAGERTQYLQGVLGFLSVFQGQFQRTREFCRKLREHDLLEPMQVQFTTGSGEQTSLTGFMAVNRDRLKALPDGLLGEMARTDELELVYTHLQSMRNFQPMAERAIPKKAAEAATKSVAKKNAGRKSRATTTKK